MTIFPIYISEDIFSQQVSCLPLFWLQKILLIIPKFICSALNQRFNMLLLKGLFLLKQLCFGASHT